MVEIEASGFIFLTQYSDYLEIIAGGGNNGVCEQGLFMMKVHWNSESV